MRLPEQRQRSPADRGGRRPVHVCVECEAPLVYPLEWEHAGHGRWTVWLRCPNCHWSGCGTFDADVVDRFDEELESGVCALRRDLKVLARANMVEDVERFGRALRAGAVLPEDF